MTVETSTDMVGSAANVEESNSVLDTIVIGAGQAGLSAAHHLLRKGLKPFEDFVVLDSNDGPGGAWRHRWDTLTFDRAHGLHPLPGMALDTPDPKEPASAVVARYYGSYEDHFDIPVIRPFKARKVTGSIEDGFTVTAADGTEPHGPDPHQRDGDLGQAPLAAISRPARIHRPAIAHPGLRRPRGVPGQARAGGRRRNQRRPVPAATRGPGHRHPVVNAPRHRNGGRRRRTRPGASRWRPRSTNARTPGCRRAAWSR